MTYNVFGGTLNLDNHNNCILMAAPARHAQCMLLVLAVCVPKFTKFWDHVAEKSPPFAYSGFARNIFVCTA